MKKNQQTQLIHAPRQAPQLINTIQPPLYRASTIIFDNTDALFNRHWTDDYDYSYGTHGTPTTFTLGDNIAQIEGGKYALLAPSGLSAINLVNSCFLSQGDEVWVADNIYGPNMEHLQNLKSRYGISVKVYNPIDASTFQPTEKAKLLWLEAAGSVTLEFPDLVNLVKKAKQLNILTALDNTWGAGLAFNAFDFSDKHLSVDITVHALTKYPSGGGDILMGSIVTRNQKLHHQLFRMHAIQGISISGDDVSQIQRSLSSMQLRYEHQSQSAIKLLNWLKQQKEFVQVLHPSDEASAGHTYWKEVCKQGHSAGLVSVILDPKYTFEDVRKFCDALTLFKLGFSWGGPVSLVMLYNLNEMRSLEHTHLKQGFLVRFCIGLEHSEDLIQDIENAIKTLNKP
ncbi:PLP-dependent transferase [Acinetobacter faecalis]|uniref:Cystathionine beta-lyase n=1 Tax=Acinetobacter faecalis TaxID=2665161 RepID=A0A6L6GBX1_9GAMM|nr:MULTISPECIES: PLP-dependent transferase [Acinetobacter]MBP7783334.1 PLP-dependent transferase [Acinetobacter sp.]MBP7793562.1 PLP-dependent transferase [Acinetobacter sp.]MBP8063871.1 PLP-dependent transferase [Acinetobacter sp.]MDY6460907.1 PLP-dependent transferase [Acinetobacter faecalis]MDY6485839.1 PLP-dependent transferase [Acinetobacter faecalis]